MDVHLCDAGWVCAPVTVGSQGVCFPHTSPMVALPTLRVASLPMPMTLVAPPALNATLPPALGAVAAPPCLGAVALAAARH